jgi:outer membrane protein assembly factor BamB
MSPKTPRFTRRRILIGVGVLAVLVAGAAVYVVRHQPGDVFNPSVEFRPEPSTPPATSPPAKRRRKENPAASFEWPFYGYTPERRRTLAVSGLRPPFRKLWRVKAGVLVEFPPVMGARSLYVLDDAAVLRAINKTSGHVRWKRKLGVLAASSPAYGNGRVYVTILSRARNRAGRVVALRTRDGKIVWSRPLPSRSESSPLLDRGWLFFGTEDGTVFALGASDGHVRWRFHAQGAVKGGPALADGKLYFGDYAGRVYALRRGTGKPVWQVGTSGARFGFSSGRFYATPSVAYGRVYLGNTDGNVYSYSVDSGALAWRHRTSNYVYSSAAVGQPPGGRPTVYVGSYDGTFYALDARSGHVRWRYRDGGSISGGATLIGNIVYFSNIRQNDTTGLNARTGRRVFHFPDGAYNPVIADPGTIYLTGKKKLYGLRPRRSAR